MTLRKTYITLIFLSFLLPFRFVYAESSPVPLNQENLQMAQQMGDMYARHLFSDYCLKSFGFYVTDLGDDAIMASPELSKKLVLGCKCMTDYIASGVPSNVVIKYLMIMEGGEFPKVTSPEEGEAFFIKAGVGKMIYVLSDDQARKKCGFAR